MASNPYVNKVVKADGTTIIDISDTTATASDVASGKYFYTAAGAKVQGTGSGGSIPDGDNLSYGTAGLAGTTWYFNETISLPSANVSYDLNFTSNSTDYLEMSKVGPPGALMYGDDMVYVDYGFIAPVWLTDYRTISITGGTDATNADLIAWIEANATEVTA